MINDEILFDKDRKDLIKLTFFFIQYMDEEIYNFFFEENYENDVIFIKLASHFKEEIKLIVQKGQELGLLKLDYLSGNKRLILTKPLIVKDIITDDQFNEIRKIWSSKNTGELGLMGDLKYSKRVFASWRLQNPMYSFDEIMGACKEYIRIQRSKRSFIMKFPSFINNDKGSTLLSILQDMDDDDAKSENPWVNE